MNEITFIDLLNNLKNLNYKQSDIDMVIKAYHKAESLHSGQIRESGEPYIIHPLNVAYILSEEKCDAATICAGLLHDTLEDTVYTKQDIIDDFGEEIANLVDGVTKLKKLDFSSKSEQNDANISKLIDGFTKDPRIIVIKLADRLHNMRTLKYKNILKQKENAMETINLFSPFAYYIGAYKIKGELEDLSLKYLYPDEYKKTEEIRNKVEEDSASCLNEMLKTIDNILSDNNIPHEVKTRTKNIYGIYKGLSEGKKLPQIHDLLALKVMVDTIPICYQTLGLVHGKYHPVNEMFKDYICNPKTNMYRSLHTTVFGPYDKLVQTQIRTYEMEEESLLGLPVYLNKGMITKEYQAVETIKELKQNYKTNKEFVEKAQYEIFVERVYAYTTKGKVIELPKGSTVIDFAYQIHTIIGNHMVSALVNDQQVSPNYVLKTNDRVQIITDMKSCPKEEWLRVVQTSRAKRKIKEFLKK